MSKLLSIEGLRTVFRGAGGDVPAVDGVSISVEKGRTLGIVGESGCGKSILSLSIMRLVPPPGRIAAGRVMFDGRDLLTLSPSQMREVRGLTVAFPGRNGVSRAVSSASAMNSRPAARSASSARAAAARP